MFTVLPVMKLNKNSRNKLAVIIFFKSSAILRVATRKRSGLETSLFRSRNWSRAFVSDRTIEGLRGGISTQAFGKFLMKLMNDWKIIDVYQERAAEAIEFQYTYWPDPDNRTARGQEFINVCTAVNSYTLDLNVDVYIYFIQCTSATFVWWHLF